MRSLDDGGAFAVWVPAPDPTQPACGHGMWIETELDRSGSTPTDEIVLLLRPAERLADNKARVDGEPVKVTVSLSTGHCTPLDERAERLLEHSAWFAAEVVEYLDKLRERARRAAVQADRETSFREAFEARTPGAMMPYERLFPADWDLFLQHKGKLYWAVDHHCLNPSCTCAAVVVELHAIETPKAEFIGEARLDLRDRNARPSATTPLAEELFARLWTRSREELLRRHHEVRNLVRRTADRGIAVRPSASSTRSAVPRNAPCPCGSGRKYKRCCADRDEARVVRR
jgi:uncharacterized protein YchJ